MKWVEWMFVGFEGFVTVLCGLLSVGHMYVGNWGIGGLFGLIALFGGVCTVAMAVETVRG